MRYKLLGRSGLRVSEMSLGAMTFGDEWGWGAGKEESRRVFDAYVDAGGNFIDTANFYTNGTSEKFVGEFVGQERERYVIATKYSLNVRPDDPNGGGNHRKNMMQSVEASLKRLGTDYVDLYWLHAWDFATPDDEVMRGLDDLVSSGKVLYIGISDTPAWVVSRANTIAELRGWSRFVGLQIQYSLIDRTPERDLLPMARELDIAVTPWGALGAGVLTGKYSGKDKHSRGDWGNASINARNLAIADHVGQVAKEIDRTPSQVALAWVRQQPYGVIVPIVGARTEAQLRDNLASIDVTLSDEQLRSLDEATSVELGFPHEFLQSDTVKQIIFGENASKIDNHRA